MTCDIDMGFVCLSLYLSVCLSHVSKQTYISTYFFHCLLPSFLHVNDQLVHTEIVTDKSLIDVNNRHFLFVYCTKTAVTLRRLRSLDQKINKIL